MSCFRMLPLRVIMAVLLLFVTMLMSGVAVVHAVVETYEFSSSELNVRYQRLSQELRCPKCQNQNIAGSNSPISKDLRRLLYKKLEAGDSDDEILNFMVERYGEFVRYRPVVDKKTAVLWYGPVAFTVIGLLVLGIHLKQRTAENIQSKQKNDAGINEHAADAVTTEQQLALLRAVINDVPTTDKIEHKNQAAGNE